MESLAIKEYCDIVDVSFVLHPYCIWFVSLHCHRGDSQGADNTWKRARSLFRGSTRAFPEVLPEDEAVRELVLQCDKVEIWSICESNIILIAFW